MRLTLESPVRVNQAVEVFRISTLVQFELFCFEFSIAHSFDGNGKPHIIELYRKIIEKCRFPMI